MSWPVASFSVLARGDPGRLRLVRAHPPARRGWWPWWPRWRRWRWWGGWPSRPSPTSSPPPTSCCSPASRWARSPASWSVRSPRWCPTSSSARARGRPGRWWAGAASGVAGALVAHLWRGREPSRIALAAVCGLAGLAFGAFMDVYQWSFTYSNDPGSYLVVASTSLPYNLAHAIGNVAFCLLIGPAFIRALRRYRRRFDVRWAVPAVALLLLVVAPSAAMASTSTRAADYLLRAQNRDGGFGNSRGRLVERADDRLGGTRPGRRSQEPGVRQAAAGAHHHPLPGAHGRPAARPGRDRAHHPGAQVGGSVPTALRRAQPGGRAGGAHGAATARSAARSATPPSGSWP